MTKHCFTSISDPNAQVLVLGSLPGDQSLLASEYYAHPRNTFWWIMESLFNVRADSNYCQRLSGLKQAGVALWDVVAECQRNGSLDSAIKSNTVVANNIIGFVAAHPALKAIAFNGKAAQQLFQRHILGGSADSPEQLSHLAMLAMPSTSPANAQLTKQQKLAQWREITTYLS